MSTIPESLDSRRRAGTVAFLGGAGLFLAFVLGVAGAILQAGMGPAVGGLMAVATYLAYAGVALLVVGLLWYGGLRYAR